MAERLPSNCELIESAVDHLKSLTERNEISVMAVGKGYDKYARPSSMTLSAPDDYKADFVEQQINGKMKNCIVEAVISHAKELKQTMKQGKRFCLAEILGQCESTITDARKILGGEVRNETELRFAIGDHIVKLICNYWKYWVSSLFSILYFSESYEFANITLLHYS